MKGKLSKLFVFFWLMLCINFSYAEKKPLWELGIGLGGISLPNYLGSNQNQNYVLPVPYIIYRGEFFKSDRKGMRGTFLESENLDINVSGNLSPPIKSDEIEARKEMSDLKSVLEIGPQVDWRFWYSQDQSNSLKLSLPIRLGIKAQSKPKTVGWVFNPKINLDITQLPHFEDWNFGVQVGINYGSRDIHDYYYQVKNFDATAERSIYSTKAGYGGAYGLMSFSKRFPSYWIGGYVRYDNLSGAVFADSPLVKQKHNYSVGLAISWIFHESSVLVSYND